MDFVASVIGTNRTTSNVRLESAFGGRAEAGFQGREGCCCDLTGHVADMSKSTLMTRC
jgi:hypothetical protein